MGTRCFNTCEAQCGNPQGSIAAKQRLKGTAASSATRDVCPYDFTQEDEFSLSQAREVAQQDAVGCLLASSKDRTETDPPEKGQHMSPNREMLSASQRREHLARSPKPS